MSACPRPHPQNPHPTELEPFGRWWLCPPLVLQVPPILGAAGEPGCGPGPAPTPCVGLSSASELGAAQRDPRGPCGDGRAGFGTKPRQFTSRGPAGRGANLLTVGSQPGWCQRGSWPLIYGANKRRCPAGLRALPTLLPICTEPAPTRLPPAPALGTPFWDPAPLSPCYFPYFQTLQG